MPGLVRAMPIAGVSLLCACYLSREPADPPSPCGALPPEFRCVANAPPCAPRPAVSPECRGLQWTCPPDSELYAPPWRDDVCLPLAGELDPTVDGVHEAPVPVPMRDQCLWLVPIGGADLPTPVHGLAEPGASCDETRLLTSASVVDIDEPDAHVGVQAHVTAGDGGSRLLVRGWRFDDTAAFGVRALGVGFASIVGQRVQVPPGWLFDTDADFGDAAVVFEDHVYAYGCPGAPQWLLEDCFVTRAPVERIDDADAWSVYGEDGWGRGEPVRVFGSGPHRGPVFADPRGDGFVHVYVIGFGSDLEVARAPRPEGPWSAPRKLADCQLPADDPDAYCAGPVVHLHLWDAFAPDELIVGYSIGTTAEDGTRRREQDPKGYAPRMQRMRF